METFDPDYVAINSLLEALGISSSCFDSIRFKLFQQRLAKLKAMVQVDVRAKWLQFVLLSSNPSC